ncbi:MAG: PKD domain-containing protein, partial [Flavobacteriales bacterium]|nr:PKD domain-containing protein [Flavobacteriales bacterium]
TLVVNDNGNVFTVTYVQHAYVDTGTYTATLTLYNGCGNSTTDDVTVTISNGQPAAIDFVWSSPLGGGNYGMCDEVEFFAIGGVTYMWDFGDGDTLTTNNITTTHTFLDSGTYTVTMAGTNGCGNSDVVLEDITIDGFNLSVSTTADACDLAVGTATVTTGGGVPPFTYLWDDSLMQTTATAMGLEAGTYEVEVSKAGGCMETISVIVGTAAAMVLTPSPVNPLSCGASDGSASVIVTGNGPFSYLWDDPASQTTDTAMGLVAGSYYVDITDAYGCEEFVVVNLSDPGAGTISISGEDVNCFGGMDGSATATITGGTGPFTYEWDDTTNATTATVTGLAEDVYTVEIIGSTGCVASASVTITEPAGALAVSAGTVTDATTPGGSEGAASVMAAGGTSPYVYAWNTSPVQATASVTGLIAGTYTAVVTDDNGCMDSVTVTVLDGPVSVAGLDIKSSFIVHPNPNNGQFELDIENANGLYLVTLRNIIGKLMYQKKVIVDGSTKIAFDNTEQPTGLYFLTLESESGISTVKVIIK